MRSQVSYNNILNKLHTNSAYISHDLKIGDDNRLNFNNLSTRGSVRTLRNNELQFYKSFFPEVNSEEEFFEEIRKFFQDIEEVRANILAFSNQNISKAIDTYITQKTSQPVSTNITIKIVKILSFIP